MNQNRNLTQKNIFSSRGFNLCISFLLSLPSVSPLVTNLCHLFSITIISAANGSVSLSSLFHHFNHSLTTVPLLDLILSYPKKRDLIPSATYHCPALWDFPPMRESTTRFSLIRVPNDKIGIILLISLSSFCYLCHQSYAAGIG